LLEWILIELRGLRADLTGPLFVVDGKPTHRMLPSEVAEMERASSLTLPDLGLGSRPASRRGRR
jgi:hypothetical protein